MYAEFPTSPSTIVPINVENDDLEIRGMGPETPLKKFTSFMNDECTPLRATNNVDTTLLVTPSQQMNPCRTPVSMTKNFRIFGLNSARKSGMKGALGSVDELSSTSFSSSTSTHSSFSASTTSGRKRKARGSPHQNERSHKKRKKIAATCEVSYSKPRKHIPLFMAKASETKPQKHVPLFMAEDVEVKPKKIPLFLQTRLIMDTSTEENKEDDKKIALPAPSRLRLEVIGEQAALSPKKPKKPKFKPQPCREFKPQPCRAPGGPRSSLTVSQAIVARVRPNEQFPEIMDRARDEKLTLLDTYKMIDYWAERMSEIYAKEWEKKMEAWSEDATDVFRTRDGKGSLLHVETQASSTFPSFLEHLDRILTPEDKHWREVLISTAKVKKIEAPSFSSLVHQPEDCPNAVSQPLQFRFKVSFGYSYSQLAYIIDVAMSVHSSILADQPQRDLRNVWTIIAKFVGNTRVDVDLTIYFDKNAQTWWEQDGVARILAINPNNGQREDVVACLRGNEVTYCTQDWLEHNAFLTSNYPDMLAGLFAEANGNIENWRSRLTKLFITWICCQLVHMAIKKTPQPTSPGAQNMLTKLSVVLKVWFLGVLTGEGFTPGPLEWIRDPRGEDFIPKLPGGPRN